MPANIYVIGDLILDQYSYGQVSGLSAEAPVPVLKNITTQDYLGGAGNLTEILAILSFSNPSPVHLASLVGQSAEYSISRLFEGLQKRYPYLHLHTLVAPDYAISIKHRVMSGNYLLARMDFEPPSSYLSLSLTSRDAAIELQKEIGLSNLIRQENVIVFSDYDKGSCGAFPSVEQKRSWVIVDPKHKPIGFYKGADILTPNLNEFRIIHPHTTTDVPIEIAVEASRACQKYDIGAIAVTLGERGVALGTADSSEHISPYVSSKPVIDVTGAGDSITAGIAYILSCRPYVQASKQNAIKEAVTFGNACAGIYVTSPRNSNQFEQDVKDVQNTKTKNSTYKRVL